MGECVGFVEEQFEKDLASNPAFALPTCWYWIRKLQACFYAARYTAAIEAAEKARRLLWTTVSFLDEAEYHFYAALARLAVYDSAPTDQKGTPFQCPPDSSQAAFFMGDQLR
jgi:hypothetical protein